MHVLKALSLPMFRWEGPNRDVTADLKVSATLCSYLVPGWCKKLVERHGDFSVSRRRGSYAT